MLLERSLSMPKFQVVSGFHVDEEGRKYSKGEVVESPHDLTATFRGKFTRVEATIADFRPQGGPPIAYTDRPLTAPQMAPVAPQPGGPAIASQPAETAETGIPGSLGEDVTARFSKAVEQDYKVFKKGPKFFVADSDSPNKPLNPDGAKRDEVDGIIEKALKPE
jgi:hypothetical protein